MEEECGQQQWEDRKMKKCDLTPLIHSLPRPI